MTTQDAFMLLEKTPAFASLPKDVLAALSKEMTTEIHPKGQTILRQNGPAAEHLRIIKSGSVKVFVRTNEGEEVVVAHRSAGDLFGLISLVYGDLCPDTIVAAEDTACFLIKKETVLGLLKTQAPFSEFCLKAVLARLVDTTYKDIRDRTLLYGGGDKLLFTNILGDVAVRNVVTASEDISIQRAAEIMASHKISSLVLLDSEGRPAGMITDRDLRNKVVAKGRDTAGPVGGIMSVTIIKSDARDHCFEALLKMMRYNIHHLLVVNKGELTGILTNHDLMMLQGTSPMSLAGEIENQTTVDGLTPAAKKINRLISILIKEGARASTITRIITEINDRLLRKLLEITEKKLGPPPVSYCWIVYGSEGRKEQTFKTDQDNALIYDDAGKDDEASEQYFADLAGRMKDALIRCGFPACTADYMASNPKWRQPLGAWKAYFSRWINTPAPDSILQSLVLFDFRPVYGNLLLAEKLRAFLGHEISGKKPFLGQMAASVVRNRPPLGLFGRFVCEKKGSRKGTFNIKINALCPIIDAARLSALEIRAYQTSTLARLMELKDRQGTAAGECSGDLEQAFEFLMSLRLRHQYQQIERGIEPDNFIDPRALGVMERKMLKETFKLILSVQEATKRKYGEYAAL
jgi:CBS domain-containing protein